MKSSTYSPQARPERTLAALSLGLLLLMTLSAAASDVATAGRPRSLADIEESGYIRHLGVPYANFVTGAGDGLDVEVIKFFADYLGVQYVYVRTNWKDVIPGAIGREVIRDGQEVRLGDAVAVTGDLIANGLTRIPWREEVLDYSLATFPTQIWLLARGDSPFDPIVPSGSPEADIQQVQALMSGRTVLCKANTCLDPSLYNLERLNAQAILFGGLLNELAPAVIDRKAETTILDVPDALVALRKWPGRVKVLGPVSPPQEMGVGFPKQSAELREAFNAFFAQLWDSGVYLELVRKYYPTALEYYPEFFERTIGDPQATRMAETK